jgi:hypothetical protein
MQRKTIRKIIKLNNSNKNNSNKNNSNKNIVIIK